MSSFSGARFGPGYRRKKRAGSAITIRAWALSLLVHGAVLIGLGYVMLGSGTPVAGNGAGRGEVVLDSQWGVREPRPAPQVVSFTTTGNRAPNLIAPELLAPMRQPIFDPHVAPASATIPAEQPPRPPIQAASAASSAPPAAGPGTNGTETQIFGLRSRGARFVYVFDRSSSMEGGLLSAAKRELIASLQALDGRHQFQIIFYNERPQLMPAVHGTAPRMAFADEPGKRLAADYIGGVFADGGTNHLQALDMALALKPDVIFFLTDAEEPQMRPEELAMVRRLNRGTRINTIEFGVGGQKPVLNFLQVLAAENGGQHAYVDVRLLRR